VIRPVLEVEPGLEACEEATAVELEGMHRAVRS